MNSNKVSRINGQFQQWQSLLQNRTKRMQTGKFVIQGVRPINAAMEQSVTANAVLYKEGKLSDWASNILRSSGATKKYELTVELMKLLGEKDENVPEVLLIARQPDIDLGKIQATKLKSQFILVLDRPQNPGNIGAVVRSADALGAGMVIISGHAADAYDPKSIRASRGSLFALPVVTVESHNDVLEWANKQTEKFSILGLSEDGNVNLSDTDLKVPAIAVIGNETWGLSKQWKEACTQIVVIPMQGTASSLNAASSAAIVMYEYSTST